jgi:hypothetical protein
LCPACWEGLLFLDKVKQFDVCGHHFVPYAVELPLWLPPAVVDAMCERFRALVTEELQVLLESPDVSLPSSSGIPRQSQESQSNISIASSHTTDHIGADHLKESFAGVWSFIKVSLFLHVPFLKGPMVWSDSEFVGYSTWYKYFIKSFIQVWTIVLPFLRFPPSCTCFGLPLSSNMT